MYPTKTGLTQNAPILPIFRDSVRLETAPTGECVSPIFRDSVRLETAPTGECVSPIYPTQNSEGVG